MKRTYRKNGYTRSIVNRVQLWLVLVVLVSSIGPMLVSADIVWEDNFDDLDDWTIFGYESDTSLVQIEGNFSAADGTLKVLDDGINFARHNSTVNVGTWSFDMFVPDPEDDVGAMYVYIMSNGSRPIPTYPSDFVAVGAWRQNPSSSWHFIVWAMNGHDWKIHSTIYRTPIQGWHHIEVCRTSDGHFYVYFNGTLKADFIYNDVTISTYLEFYCYSATGAAIDNLVVEDTLLPTPTPTTTPTETTTTTTPTTTPTDGGFDTTMILLIGGGVAAIVVIVLIVWKIRGRT